MARSHFVAVLRHGTNVLRLSSAKFISGLTIQMGTRMLFRKYVMKTQNRYLLLAACWLLIGCAGHDYHRLDCKYRALIAGHAAEMLWGVASYVATDKDHAQAFYFSGNNKIWLTARDECVVRNVPREVGDKVSIWTLKQWDQLLRLEG